MSQKLTKEAIENLIRSELDETWQTGGSGRDSIMEELRRQGIKWYLYADWYSLSQTPPTRGLAPWIGGGTFSSGQRLRNGNTLICDYEADCIYEVNDDWEVIWSFGVYGVSGDDLTHLNNPKFVYFDEDNGLILIADSANSRILEVSYLTGTVSNVLTSTNSGVLVNPSCAVYAPDGEILITNSNAHFVVKTDWNGNESWTWGTYGTSGQTEVPQTLRGPETAFIYPSKSLPTYYVVIADYGNDRILFIQQNGTVSRKIVAPRPQCAELRLDRGVVMSNIDLCFAVDRAGDLLSYMPFAGGYCRPTIDGTYLVSTPYSVREIDPHFFKPYALPLSRSLLRGYSLVAGESVGPIYSGADNIEGRQVLITFPHDKVSFYVRSTQIATLEHLIARTDVTGGFSTFLKTLYFIDWIPIDSIALAANTWDITTVTDHAPMMAVRITMGGTGGNLDVFTSRLPKAI